LFHLTDGYSYQRAPSNLQQVAYQSYQSSNYPAYNSYDSYNEVATSTAPSETTTTSTTKRYDYQYNQYNTPSSQNDNSNQNNAYSNIENNQDLLNEMNFNLKHLRYDQIEKRMRQIVLRNILQGKIVTFVCTKNVCFLYK